MFIGQPKTREETLEYIKEMTLTPNVDPLVYVGLTNKHIKEVSEYIRRSFTATTFTNREETKSKLNDKTVYTSELIYYWMVSLNIPFECELWPLNRLITLIRIINVKNAPGKKMSKSEVAARNRELNAQRKAQKGTGG